MQPQVASQFRDAVVHGRWNAALGLLPALTQGEESEAAQARFLLTRQKYLEQVSAGDAASALRTLRAELVPLGVQRRVLHGLSKALLQPRAASAPASEAPRAREALLAELQHLLPPSLLIPDRRLEELVEQALLAQAERCRYLNCAPGQQSLFVDLQAGPEQLPSECTQALEMHADEVWALQFSADGRWLASAGKDGAAVLWEVEPGPRGRVRYARHLTRSGSPINTVAFSPDGARVLTSGSDGRVRLHRLPSGDLEREIGFAGTAGADFPVNAAAWFPDSRHFLAALLDKALYVADAATGAVTRRLKQTQHTYDVVVSRDGSTVVTVGQDRRLRFHRLADGREASVAESGAVTCLSVSRSGDYLLANLASAVIHLWPLGDLAAPEQGALDGTVASTGAPPAAQASAPQEEEIELDRAMFRFPVDGEAGAQATPAAAPPTGPLRPGAVDPLDALAQSPLQEFRVGSQQERFVIRTCLGGHAEAFVASGGEEGRVRIWHRDSGALLQELGGHAGTINAVAWSPSDNYLLASASDDKTIRIWRAPAALAASAAARG